MMCIVRRKLASIMSLLTPAALVASIIAGCGKTRDISADPGGARTYEPFDLLSGCAKSGCEINLDAPRFEGVLRRCDGAFTEADVTSPDFDYEAACASLDDSSYRIVAGRRVYELGVAGPTSPAVGGMQAQALGIA